LFRLLVAVAARFLAHWLERGRMNLYELSDAVKARGIYVARGDEGKTWSSCPVAGCHGTMTASENGHGLMAECTDGHDLREILDEFEPDGRGAKPYEPKGVEPPAAWVEGEPCDPFAESPEPLEAFPGIPFAYRPASVLVSAPTGSGKSCLLEAALYDAVMSEPYQLRGAYLSGEVGQAEFNARVRDLAERRGDDIEDGSLLNRLGRSLRWLDLPPVIERAWRDPELWADDVARLYNVVAIDPVSSVASALALDFDKSNSDYVEYHDRLIKPLIDRGVLVLQVDNIGTRSKPAAAPRACPRSRTRRTSCCRAASGLGRRSRSRRSRSAASGPRSGAVTSGRSTAPPNASPQRRRPRAGRAARSGRPRSWSGSAARSRPIPA
jgi:hypothetical protein